MTYREQLENAIAGAQPRFRFWPARTRAQALRELLEDLRKLEAGLQPSEVVALRKEIADQSRRLDHLEQAVALKRLAAGRPEPVTGRLA